MNNPAFNELTVLEKYEFIHKLIIAGQNDYYGECTEVVSRAQKDGLYERIKPLLGTVAEIANDLDKPINY